MRGGRALSMKAANSVGNKKGKGEGEVMLG